MTIVSKIASVNSTFKPKVEGERKKRRPKDVEEAGWGRSVKVDLSSEDALH